ncbi:MAG: hypothetical protein QM710_15225 [Flavobacterium sp.]
MKKYWMFLLQFVSLLLFIVIGINAFRVIGNIIAQSKRGWEYNLGYFVGAIIVFTLLFWLNVKLYKFSTSK